MPCLDFRALRRCSCRDMGVAEHVLLSPRDHEITSLKDRKSLGAHLLGLRHQMTHRRRGRAQRLSPGSYVVTPQPGNWLPVCDFSYLFLLLGCAQVLGSSNQPELWVH